MSTVHRLRDEWVEFVGKIRCAIVRTGTFRFGAGGIEQFLGGGCPPDMWRGTLKGQCTQINKQEHRGLSGHVLTAVSGNLRELNEILLL